MTTGQFFYSPEGKVLKVFGPDDHDALLLLRKKMEIIFVTADHRGLEITKKRIVEDMKFPLEFVSMTERVDWIRKRMDPAQTIYMGDGILDSYIFDAVGYSICPSDGFYLTKKQADYVTRAGGGNRAVAEACLHILERFFPPFNLRRYR